MKKIKALKLGGGFSLFKLALTGVVITLAGILIFAVVLKFVDMSSGVISFVNNLIKIISIFIITFALFKVNKNKFLINAMILGLVYHILCFLIFSILNKSFVFGLSFVFDMLLVIVTSIISAILINLMIKRA